VAATSKGLLRSADNGRTWSRQLLGDSQAVNAVAQASGSGRLHAATPLGFYASIDDGQSWLATAGPATEGVVRRLLASPIDERMLFAATTRGLLKSHDGGRTWRMRGGGLPLADITALALSADGQRMLAADHTYGGLYSSTDLGEIWTPVPTDDLPSRLLWSLALVPDSGELLAGAATGGLNRLKSSAPSSSAPAASLGGPAAGMGALTR
jgi:photosystem II stability/assembly factor-like uncharacterized protein